MSIFKPINQAQFKNASVIMEGDTKNEIRIRLLNADSQPVDVTGQTVTWTASSEEGLSIEPRAATIYPAGEVGINFLESDGFGNAIVYIQIQVEWSNGGGIERFPADGNLFMKVTRASENLRFTPAKFITWQGIRSEWEARFNNFTAEVSTGIRIKGAFATEAELPSSAEVGDGYVIQGNVWIWNGTDWDNVGSIQGPKGDKGDTGSQGIQGIQGATGADGKNIEFSWTGTALGVRQEGEANFQYVNLQGPQGLQGIQGIQGAKGDQGEKGDVGAGLNILGSLASEADLPATGNLGEGYLIGGMLYVWNGTEWENVGSVQGPKGDKGDQGIQGIQGIQGVKGDTGSQGPKGDTGATGAAGKNLEFLWTGTTLGVRQEGETTYTTVNLQGPQGIQGVKGDTGDQGIQGIKGDKGDTGTAGTNGTNGKSLEFTWNGTQLGIRQEGTVNYTYVDLKGAKGDTGLQGDQGIPGTNGLNLEYLWSGTSLGVRQQGQSTYTYTNLIGPKGDKGDKGDQGIPGTNATLNIENRTTDPASPTTGQIWIRTDL